MDNFTADQVWGAAAAAHRINGGYVKMDQRSADGLIVLKEANKAMVKRWLREGQFPEVTEADVEAGRQARAHFKSYTFLAIAGRLNEFQTTALKIAAKEAFTNRDLYDFSVVSCLPSVAERDQQQTQLKKDIYASEQLTAGEGDQITGEISVIRSRYSAEYDRYRIDAQMGESFVDFWFSKDYAPGTLLRIRAKIKKHRENKTTQLNYVKVVG